MSKMARTLGLAVLATLLVVVGCDDGNTSDEDTGTDTAVDNGIDTTADTGDPDTAEDPAEDPVGDTTPDTTVDPTEDPVEDPVEDTVEEEVVVGSCGNGTEEDGEVCDDGNTETEACDSTTTPRCAADCSMRLDLCGNGADDPGEQCDDGDDDSHDGCTTSCTVNDGHIGSPCTCTSGCEDIDFTAGTIVGCDAAAAEANASRTLGCVRSAYNAIYGIEVYSAQGYCQLMALGCSGTLCGMVPTTGNVDTFDCPAGYVEATEVRTEMGMTITAKSCLVACTSDIDCRWNEDEDSESPWADSCGEYACLPVGDGGELACTDARN